jgi:hypothetical protein
VGVETAGRQVVKLGYHDCPARAPTDHPELSCSNEQQADSLAAASSRNPKQANLANAHGFRHGYEALYLNIGFPCHQDDVSELVLSAPPSPNSIKLLELFSGNPWVFVESRPLSSTDSKFVQARRIAASILAHATWSGNVRVVYRKLLHKIEPERCFAVCQQAMVFLNYQIAHEPSRMGPPVNEPDRLPPRFRQCLA